MFTRELRPDPSAASLAIIIAVLRSFAALAMDTAQIARPSTVKLAKDKLFTA